MIVHSLTLGAFGVNNYILQSEKSPVAILIDACEAYTDILKAIETLQLELVYLINTHGHADHIAGNEKIIEATGAKLLFPSLELPYLNNADLNLSWMAGMRLTSPEPDRLLSEGDIVELEEIALSVLHTPGHTPGHISLIGDREAFVGDVIFRESVGRTDFPGGSMSQLTETIQTKIYTLDDDRVLYNGHGPETTAAHEKKYNPFVRLS